MELQPDRVCTRGLVHVVQKECTVTEETSEYDTQIEHALARSRDVTTHKKYKQI